MLLNLFMKISNFGNGKKIRRKYDFKQFQFTFTLVFVLSWLCVIFCLFHQ